ncbi:hypothetical protein D3C87_1297490 [compost metagenome]
MQGLNLDVFVGEGLFMLQERLLIEHFVVRRCVFHNMKVQLKNRLYNKLEHFLMGFALLLITTSSPYVTFSQADRIQHDPLKKKRQLLAGD